MATYSALAQYLFDEAASGTTPSTVVDSVGSADLSITYNSNGAWTSIAAGNGFDFTAAALSATGAIIRSAGGVLSGLQSQTEASVTLVIDFDSIGAGGCRGFHFGSTAGAGYFHLTFNDQYSCVFGWADEDDAGNPQYNTAAYSDVNLTASGVKIFHVVVDTTQAVADDRVKIYMDGSLLTFLDTNIEQNTAIPTISSSHYLTVGNDGNNSNGFDGRIYYFELGSGQLTGSQISNSITALLSDNDTGAYTSADTTAPVLSSPTGAATGTTTADIGVTTDEGNGTLYAVVTTSATAPSAAQIKAGQAHTGTAAAYADNQLISTVGTKSFSATGLSASTTYYAHFVHSDDAANDSTVSSSAGFTTSVADTTPPTFSTPPDIQPAANGGTGTAVIDETGDVFMVVVANNDSPPSSAQVVAGQNAAGSSALAAGSNTEITSANIGFTGLSAYTPYDAYFVARDSAGNLQADPTKVDFTTASSSTGGGALLAGFSRVIA